MTCSNCGRQIPDRSKFCPHCGNTVTRQPTPTPVPAPTPAPAPAPAPEKHGRKALWITLAAVGLVLVLALGTLLVIKLLPGGTDAPPSDPTLSAPATGGTGGKVPETETRLAATETAPVPVTAEPVGPSDSTDPPTPEEASGAEAARLFLENIEALKEQYGEIRTSDAHTLGLCVAQPVDFDNDGKDELFTVCNAESGSGNPVQVTTVFAIRGHTSVPVYTYEGVMFLSQRADRALLGAVIDGAGELDVDNYMEFYAYDGSEFRFDSDYGCKWGDRDEGEETVYYRNGVPCDMETYREGVCDVNGEYNDLYLGSYLEAWLRYRLDLDSDMLKQAAGLPSGRDTYADIVNTIRQVADLGSGMLLDIDGDGTDELLLYYMVGGIESWGAVYTQENGRARALLPENRVVLLAGSPTGEIGVVAVDGERWCFSHGYLGTTDIVGGVSTEQWLLVAVDDPAKQVKVLFRREFESMDMDEYIDRIEAGEDVQLDYTDTVTFNGEPMDPEAYQAWRDRMDYDVVLSDFWPDEEKETYDLNDLAALLSAS